LIAALEFQLSATERRLVMFHDEVYQQHALSCLTDEVVSKNE